MDKIIDDTEWPNSELCGYCFELVKDLSAFEFNYNGNGGAAVSPLYPAGSTVPFVTCVDCFAYLGASAWAVFNWDTSGVEEIAAGVYGSAKHNLDFRTNSGTATFVSDVQEIYRKDDCIGKSCPQLNFLAATVTPHTCACFISGPIMLGTWLTIDMNCVFNVSAKRHTLHRLPLGTYE